MDARHPDASVLRHRLAALAAEAGIRRVHVVAWRELVDEEAGGSEVHAHEILRRWAEAGIDVTIRTSAAPGHPADERHDGYRAIRRGSRYSVFPSAAAEAVSGRLGDRDALVEIWNGVPFLSPLWERGPRIVVVHHVHGELWHDALPPGFAQLGDLMERRVAPLFYRGTQILTPSRSSQRAMVQDLHLDPAQIHVVPNGVDDRFVPGPIRSVSPLIAAAGRLVPIKRFDALIRSAAALRTRHPALRLVIAGEGAERPALEAEIARLDAASWASLPGRIDDDDLVGLFQEAWVVSSASRLEGWGMTLTEAAACGTPSVATRTTGHLEAVADGHSGLLVDSDDQLTATLDRVLTDDALRERLSAGALEHASQFTWDATAGAALGLVADQVRRHRHRAAHR